MRKKIPMLKKYNELSDTHSKIDLHLHSNWTDGKNSLDEIIKQAEMLDLKIIAFTDHIRYDSTYFNDYTSTIKKLQSTTTIQLLAGFEARIKNFKGELDVKQSDKKNADIVIASVHRFPFADKLFAAKMFSKEIAQAIELELSLAAINLGGFDVIGHSGGMSLKQFDEFPINYFEEIIKSCAHNNIAFELNNTYHKKVYPQLKELLIRYNPIVSFGSDSHDKIDMAKGSLALL